MDAARLRELAEKYATLAAMRRREAAGELPHENVFYQRLAARFPGALKELDRLPLDEIDRRVAALEVAAAGGGVAPWMVAVDAYHEALRALLAQKRRGEPIGAPGSGRCSVVAIAAERAAMKASLPIGEVRTLLSLKPGAPLR